MGWTKGMGRDRSAVRRRFRGENQTCLRHAWLGGVVGPPPPHTLNPQSPVGRSPLGNLPGPQTNKILLCSVRSEAGDGTNGHLHTNKQ